MRRIGAGVAALLSLLMVPAPVAAHGLVGRLESPLPLAVYLTGAAIAVGLSFAFVILRDVRAADQAQREPLSVPRPVTIGLRAIGLIAWLWIVVQAVVGGSSDADVASLFLWVYGWVGLALLSALVGPVWQWLDPFATLYNIGAAVTRRLGINAWQPAPYPTRLGTWPAAAGLLFFIWLELVYGGGSLGLILIAYTFLTLLAMANFSRDVWREHGETFSVWFGLLSRMAPFGVVGRATEGRVRRRPYASGLLEPGWTSAHLVIVALGAASILYDGISQTAPWFEVFGLPGLPLATVQLLGYIGVVVGLALIVGRSVGQAAIGAGLVPIAVGYLLAHYLTYLLGDGQRIVIALSDPLQLGWDLLGTAFYEPGTDWIPPALLWTVQLGAVVGGHILGAWSGHIVAARDAPAGHNVRLRQVPLAALMVGLTATTLWSLGQAIVREPTETAPTAAASGPPAASIRPSTDLGSSVALFLDPGRR